MKKYDDVQVGMQFGMWTVVEKVPDPRHASKHICECRCSCGAERLIRPLKLWRGDTKGCPSCWTSKNPPTQHPGLYRCWVAMRQRCTNPTDPHWDRYGGRGIHLCEEWTCYETFRDWALAHGYDERLQIDRRDNDAGYSPNNCRFVTCRENNNNRKSSIVTGLVFAGLGRVTGSTHYRDSSPYGNHGVLTGIAADTGWAWNSTLNRFVLNVEAFGETKTLKEWSRDGRCRVSYHSLWRRVGKFGWDIEQAILTPVRKQRNNAIL